MAYIETIKKGRNNYYYLTNTVRIKKSFKKVRWFLGKGDITKQKLEQLAREAGKHLDEKIKSVKSIRKLSKLDKETRVKLEHIRANYQKLISSVSKVEYFVIEKQRLIRFTFNTNAIEGSTITLKETAHILEDGISPDGKDLREIYEVENTRKAYDFMKKYKGKLNIKFIKRIHFNMTYNILGENAGNFRKIRVYMGGSKHVPPTSSLLKKEMADLMRWLKNQKTMHPVELAAYFHHLFIAIHPFIDGNGRTARLLLNYMLMKSGFPPICIKREERIRYTDYLEFARDGNMDYFLEFIVNKIEEANDDIVDTIKQK